MIVELSVLCEVCKICPSFYGWLCVVRLWFQHSRSYSRMLARFCNQVSWILKSLVSLLPGVKFICFRSTCTSSWIVGYLAGCWIQSPDSHSDWLNFVQFRRFEWGETSIFSLYFLLAQFEHHPFVLKESTAFSLDQKWLICMYWSRTRYLLLT